ncbi:MAG: hypothetical protein MIL41_00535 [Hyphomicrobiales bacterium]|jgi:hypothetical protein
MSALVSPRTPAGIAAKLARRPVEGAERQAMRALAENGLGRNAIARTFRRGGPTVSRYCGDLLPAPERGPLRLLMILDIAESSTLPRTVLAQQLGFKSAGSLGVVLTRARKARAALKRAA